MYTKTEWSGMGGYGVRGNGEWVAQVQVSLFEDEPCPFLVYLIHLCCGWYFALAGTAAAVAAVGVVSIRDEGICNVAGDTMVHGLWKINSTVSV